MPVLKEIKEPGKKKTAIPDNGKATKPRVIKMTKKMAEQIRTMSKGWIHIMPSDEKWRVRKHGSLRASGIYNDINTAISAAKKIADSATNSEIFVHNTNGEVTQTIHK